MSFQAPDTDIDPAQAGGFKAPDDDLAPPAPSYLEDVGTNALKEIKAIPGSIPTMAKQALGIADLPLDALKAVPQMLGGKNLSETDVAEDVKPVIEGNKGTLNTIEHPVESFRKAPINTTMTAAGLLGGVKGITGELGETVPRGTAPPPPPPEVPETPLKAPEVAGSTEKVVPAIPETPISLKDLPVTQPGSKTGEPHALFAFNDDYGPGGTPRSVYNIFGDPGNPRLTQAGGYGSSVTKDILDQAGIPVVGREPRSVGKWEPLEAKETTPEPTPNEAGGVKAEPESPASPPKPSILESGAEKAIDQAKELKDYVSRGYEGYAKKPGAIADVADWVQEKSQMMAAQQMGVTPNQARQLGRNPLEAHNAMRAIGQYALDHDIVSPTTGLGGMLEKNNSLLKSVGNNLASYREMADKVAGEVDPKAVAQEVRDVLDKKYMRGVTAENPTARGAYGGSSGAYLRALQELEDADHSHSGIAEAATELNHAANKAAKNLQPETPFTDVANEVSRINNAKIKALIGEENAAKYEQALREYGVNKKIANALKFKSSGEVKRFGPGSTFSNLTQKAMDELGYRVGAKTANKLSTAIKNNPAMAGNLPSLFKEFIHQVEEVGHDTTGLAFGGQIPKDVRDYVTNK